LTATRRQAEKPFGELLRTEDRAVFS